MLTTGNWSLSTSSQARLKCLPSPSQALHLTTKIPIFALASRLSITRYIDGARMVCNFVICPFFGTMAGAGPG
jgi:hypothetical protein